MDDIERAVLCELNPALDPAVRNAARAFCENLENSADGWSLCLEKMFKTTVMEVAFYCLGVIQNVVLHKYLTLSEADRVKLRTGLMRYLDQVLLKQSATHTLHPIRNKYAQVLVLVFKHEYPAAWPLFFTELWTALGLAPGTTQNPAGVPLWLLVLQTIDQEVVARDVPRSTAELAHNAAIKDSMREHVIKEITGLWYAILVQFHAIDRRDVVKKCLETMRPYISWIDIGLVVNDKFIPLFVQYLAVDVYREQVLDCYHEIIAKGMDVNVKLTLIEQLRITELIESLFSINDEELQCKLGELINGLGEEVLRCYETLGYTPAVNLALDHISRLCIRHLARTDVAAATVAELCTQWVGCLRRLKRDGGYSQQHVTRLGELLRVLHQKWSEDDLLTTGLSASSANIQLHGELSDDELREWAEFKKELSKMFKSITQLEPELVAQYIIQLMPQLPELIRMSSMNDGHKAQSELAGLLNMFYLMAEALQPEVLKNNIKFFMQVLATLTEHRVDQLTQRTVATQYFEIASRCSRILASQPATPEHQQLIGAILTAFLSPQSGIRSPLPSARARHCYLFKNFVSNLLPHLGAFTAMIINNLKDLFQFDQPTLDYRLEDKLDLFEAVSKLVGSSQDVALQQQSLVYLVNPSLQRIEEIVTKQLYKQDPPNNPRHLILLANLIQSIGTFSKGFPSKQIQPQVADLWKKATEVVIKTYEQLPNIAEIFKQLIFFFHRMVECLGTQLLPYLTHFVPRLLTHLQNVPQFVEFIVLVAQMNDTFEDKMLDVVSALYLPLCDRVTSALSHETQVTPGSEDERELNELKKTYYYFLSSVCEHKLLSVLIAPAHMPRFEQVLQLVLTGCSYWTEPTTQRRCFTILRLLSEKLCGTQPGSLQGFNAFILQHVIKKCFEVPLSPRFNLDDGSSLAVLSEIIALQKSVLAVCGEEFSSFMMTALLPSLKMTPEAAATYLNSLKSTPTNDFRNYLRAFFKQSRGS